MHPFFPPLHSSCVVFLLEAQPLFLIRTPLHLLLLSAIGQRDVRARPIVKLLNIFTM